MERQINVNKLGGKFFQSEIIKNFFAEENKEKGIYGDDGTVFVVSAFEGVTRLLRFIFRYQTEKNLSDEFREKSTIDALEEINRKHKFLINDLFDENKREKIIFQYEIIAQKLEEVIYKFKKGDDEEQFYASILQHGELFSSTFLSEYLNSIQIKNSFLDARDYVVLNKVREGDIIGINRDFVKLFKTKKIYIIQGFIGRNFERQDGVMPLDGSDISATEFSNALSENGIKVKESLFKDELGVYEINPKKSTEKPFLYREIARRRFIEKFKDGESPVHIKAVSEADTQIQFWIRSFNNLDDNGTYLR